MKKEIQKNVEENHPVEALTDPIQLNYQQNTSSIPGYIFVVLKYV
jgi:hypothetical protein